MNALPRTAYPRWGSSGAQLRRAKACPRARGVTNSGGGSTNGGRSAMNGVPQRSWRAAVFKLTSVDVVSAAIYTGVLLAHLPRSVGADSGWLSLTSIILVLLLFALDRIEAVWFPQGTATTRIALALLAVRIALMAVVVQLDASTLTWFLFLIPPLRVCLYFGSRASYAIAAVTWVGFILQHPASDPSGVAEVQQETILFA